MIAVSEQWAETVGRSHTMLTRVRVRDAVSGSITTVPVSQCTVTLDDTSSIRGTCNLTIPGSEYTPKAPTDLLAPYGNELVIDRGVRHADGTEEYVQTGVFGIEEASIDASAMYTTVTGADRAQRLSNAKFEDVYQVVKGTEIGEAIVTMGQNAWLDMPYDSDVFDAIVTTLPTAVANEGDDRWEWMQGFATALGYILYFDNTGTLTARPYQAGSPVLNVYDDDGGTLLSAERNWSKVDTFNRVIATGENSDNSAVYRGVATDDNGESPTRYDGPYGKTPVWFDSPYIQSNAQAQDAADAKLAQELGTIASVSFSMVPNPALEPGDVVRLRRTDAGINEAHVLETVSIGLGADEEMDCVTRQVFV